MDSNTPENQLDAAKLMHHSPEMRLAAYGEILNQPAPDTLLQDAAKAMHHSQEMQAKAYGQMSQEPSE
ncbi:hypothetical protein [Nostoc sp. DedQUE09]|uniref:hypothetical protein n=1 Tax=Nostoc sp. DedQUE09 TaxID=3075394 RepID=UPI002AD3B60E|nr:hypothetical protein [Nostoc sp. DedQUE09]MDZ7955890.1 hypothetical protein [Nostoc sp. DedQUE09]